jgi:hypothetical protein
MMDTLSESLCKLNINDAYIDKIIKIQSVFRRKIMVPDGLTKQMLSNMVNIYNRLYKDMGECNGKLKRKKIRMPNYPSEITENIVKFAIMKKYNVCPKWDIKSGDLCINDKHLEVKGSLNLMSGGPSSFGPNEEWHRIYFVDAVDHVKGKFVVYEVKLSNNNNLWKNLKVNVSQTFEDQCAEKRRPRIKFNSIKKQLPSEAIQIIFNGHLDDL